MMGQAKLRGTPEERRQLAIECQQAMVEQAPEAKRLRDIERAEERRAQDELNAKMNEHRKNSVDGKPRVLITGAERSSMHRLVLMAALSESLKQNGRHSPIFINTDGDIIDPKGGY